VDDQLDASGIETHEIPVSPDRLIVLYLPADTGNEIEPVELYTQIGADAGRRAGSGWELASLDSLSLRHTAAYLGREGSGYESKVAVTALYARIGA